VPSTARGYKATGLRWVVVDDSNFGEGSSREHAALQPRYLNGFAIIARSFARIYETNLKKQGLLPLTFSNPEDYERIKPDDRIDVLCADLEIGKPVLLKVRSTGGLVYDVETTHTLSQSQIE
jgi:aconitate hydratase